MKDLADIPFSNARTIVLVQDNLNIHRKLLHEKIDQLREREVLELTEAVRMLTELLEQSASAAREFDAEGERPS